jgi:hypothetical protein
MENKDMPAFPRSKQILGSGEDYHEIPASDGMSKREYLTAMAMQALISNREASCKICDSDPRYNGENFKEVVALNATEFADALLLELSKPQP